MALEKVKIDAFEMAGEAAALLRRGWALFPLHTPQHGKCSCGNAACGSPGKHPRTRNGVKDGSKDPARVARWWSMWPEANIGLACGAISGLVIIDVDGAEGEDSFRGLEAELGPLPATVEALTGKGRHLYFNHPGGIVRPTAGILGPGVDVRGDGSYVVAPPSLHATGRRYTWEAEHHIEDIALADLPEAWAHRLRADKPRGERPAEEAPIPEGQRNATLTSMAGTMRRRGLSEDAILQALLVENDKRCRPPLESREVEAIARSVARYDPAPEGRIENLTDLGNARRLVVQHGENIRYCHPESRWYVWNERVWKPDDTAAVFRLAKDTVGSIYIEAGQTDDEDKRKAIAKHAFRSESLSRLQSMIALASSEPGIPVLREQMNRDPWLLTAENGTLDLRTGKLREHRREDFITKCVPIRYDEAASAPTFKRALMEIMNGRLDLVNYLRRVCGYTLTGDVSAKALFILYGRGDNGKSLFLEILRELLGPFAVVAEPNLLMSRRGEAHPTGVAKLWGARLAIATETTENRSFNEALVKQLTGGDTLTGRFMRQDFFDFKPTHKLFLATNHRPIVRGTDRAIWERIHLIPFDVTFHKPETGKEPIADPMMLDKLRAELPGILAWAVKGCLEWQKDGLRPPAEVVSATDEYRAEMDVVAQFLEDCCILEPNAQAGATDLYTAYKNWCSANGERWLSQRLFGGRLSERGYESRRGTGGAMVYDGIGIGEDYSGTSPY